MADTIEIWVEGSNDAKVIESLLAKHSISLTIQWKPESPGQIKLAGSVEKLLESMKAQISQRRTLPIGFVVDADHAEDDSPSSVENRWRSIRDRLTALGLDCPTIPNPKGTILVGTVNEIPSRVGVWLMPNNTDPGMLEHFLQGLIEEGDELLPLAQKATSKAMSLDRRFPEIHEPKAVIHTWLAWQKKPGQQFGSAITAKSFRHDTEIALAFVSWFRLLYGFEDQRSNLSAGFGITPRTSPPSSALDTPSNS